ncbi:MAG: hypothetical protein GWO24_22880, partial [Akkermansiaceae bacterium]|nr:hypothetical protein [Akkermansiaceae bacterium]
MGGRAILLGVSIPAGYVLMNLLPLDPARIGWDPSQLLYITLYYLLLGIPFFFFGLIVSTALSLRSGESGSIYGADLIGAG